MNTTTTQMVAFEFTLMIRCGQSGFSGKHRYASARIEARLEALTREVASRSGGQLETVLRVDPVRYPEIYERDKPDLMGTEEQP